MKAGIFLVFVVVLVSCHTKPAAVKQDLNKDTTVSISALDVSPITVNVPVYSYDSSKKIDSIIQSKFDSLTASWPNLIPANPDAYFQKQYSGVINNKPAAFNVNLRAINIREQKDMVVWAAIGDTLMQLYFNEDGIFGTAVNGDDNIPVCPGCRDDSLILKNKKYLPGYDNNITAIALRFVKDSAQLEGYYFDSRYNNIIHFTLNQSTASLPLTYIVSRFHKHRKLKDDKVVEVSATAVSGIDLPGKYTPAYRQFLSMQAGDNDTSVEQVAADNKKHFLNCVKESQIPWSRSMIGGYNNTEVIYNQDGWLVIKTENAEGDPNYYGEMGYSYFCFDIKLQKLIDETDVMIDNYEDSANHEKLKQILNIENGLRGYAFVCPHGVIFRTSGNHGWEVGTTFIHWQQIMPFLRKDFIEQHANWLKN